MKKEILLTLFFGLIITLSSSSQETVNYSFFKLVVKNDKNEILLVKWKNEWEIPGRKYRGSLTVKEFTTYMASNYGVTTTNLKLRGLITFHYTTKPNPTLMQYYSANYKSGKIKVPFGSSTLKWVPLEEAYKIIPYSEMVHILQHIEKDDNTLWGGAFEIKKKTPSTIRESKIKEVLYPL
jgi:hypothetical protein